MTGQEIQEWLVARVARELEIPESEVDIRAHFTALGLDSVAVLTLTGDISTWLRRDFSETLLSTYPSIQSLVEHLQGFAVAAEEDELPRLPRNRPLPVTMAQKRLLKHAQLGRAGDGNVIAYRLRVQGKLDKNAFRRAISETVRRQESLRTTYAKEGGEFWQIVHAPFVVKLEEASFSPNAVGEEKAYALSLAAARKPMDLSRLPLFRVLLYQMGREDYRITFIVHHLLMDSRSTDIFHAEIAHYYQAFTTGPRTDLPEPGLSLADIGAWERQFMRKDGDAYQSRLTWWKEYWRAPLAPPLELPLRWLQPPATPPGVEDCYISVTLTAETTRQIREFSRKHHATPYQITLAAFAARLYQQSGCPDFAIGTYISDRKRAAAKDVIGMFGVFVPIRIRLERHYTFSHVLDAVVATMKEVALRQEMPYEDVQESLHAEGLPLPTAQVIFQQSQEVYKSFTLRGLEVGRWGRPALTQMPWGYSMIFLGSLEDETFLIKTAFDGNIYDPALCNEAIREYVDNLAAWITDPEKRLESA